MSTEYEVKMEKAVDATLRVVMEFYGNLVKTKLEKL
jgi:hypothetical protein